VFEAWGQAPIVRYLSRFRWKLELIRLVVIVQFGTYSSEVDVSVEANPYHFRITPEKEWEIQVPLSIAACIKRNPPSF